MATKKKKAGPTKTQTDNFLKKAESEVVRISERILGDFVKRYEAADLDIRETLIEAELEEIKEHRLFTLDNVYSPGDAAYFESARKSAKRNIPLSEVLAVKISNGKLSISQPVSEGYAFGLAELQVKRMRYKVKDEKDPAKCYGFIIHEISVTRNKHNKTLKRDTQHYCQEIGITYTESIRTSTSNSKGTTDKPTAIRVLEELKKLKDFPEKKSIESKANAIINAHS